MSSSKQTTKLSRRVKSGSHGQKPKAIPLDAPQHQAESKGVPAELLQLLLDIFSNAFSSQFNSNLPALIQQVKQHLFNRNFDAAFGQEEFLEAYAMRWSPSRALAYTDLFCSLPNLTAHLMADSRNNLTRSESTSPSGPIAAAQASASSTRAEDPSGVLQTADDGLGRLSRIVCIGAGAGAEIVALAGFLERLNHPADDQLKIPQRAPYSEHITANFRFGITAIDIADCNSVLTRLQLGMTAAPPLSQYSSAEKKAANRPLVYPSQYALRFSKQDVLNMELTDLAEIFTHAALVTLMFTLNELYSTSVSSTTNMLLTLTMLLSPGALLLVVDSPGSYSTVKLGSGPGSKEDGDIKEYPMKWLLDHTLLESAAVGSSMNSSAGAHQWEKLESRDSEWFRLPKGLRYPIELEDMRYQVHLYRRL